MPPTAKDHAKLIGRTGTWKIPPPYKGTIAIRVRTLDVRTSYNRIELLIEPLEGSGQSWARNVKLDPVRKGAK